MITILKNELLLFDKNIFITTFIILINPWKSPQINKNI
jgi:hypothetical protein